MFFVLMVPLWAMFCAGIGEQRQSIGSKKRERRLFENQVVLVIVWLSFSGPLITIVLLWLSYLYWPGLYTPWLYALPVGIWSICSLGTRYIK
jgi:hypothetical protein